MNLLMDIDGVLIDGFVVDENGTEIYHWTKNIEKDLGIDKDDLYNNLFKKWDDVVLGKKSTYEQVEEFLKSINSKITAKELVSYWIKNDAMLNQQVVDFTKRMYENGWNLYIGSNQESIRMNYLIENHKELFSMFKKIYISSELGVKKPQKEFFEKILKDINIKPQELVYIDDSLENINAAKEMGIRAYLYEKFDCSVLEEIYW